MPVFGRKHTVVIIQISRPLASTSYAISRKPILNLHSLTRPVHTTVRIARVRIIREEASSLLIDEEYSARRKCCRLGKVVPCSVQHTHICLYSCSTFKDNYCSSLCPYNEVLCNILEVCSRHCTSCQSSLILYTPEYKRTILDKRCMFAITVLPPTTPGRA